MGDGNCLMRCISFFICKDESKHNLLRNEIVKRVRNNIHKLENMQIETENGGIYNINIADYRALAILNNKILKIIMNLFMI